MRRTATLLLLAVTVYLAACSPDRGRKYTVRGQVTQLPNVHDPGALYLEHEAIDDWVDRDGKMVGMYPMTMPFPIAKSVSLDGIAVGDIVEATLRVDWEAETRQVEIVQLRELPAGTKLEFRAPEPGKHTAH